MELGDKFKVYRPRYASLARAAENSASRPHLHTTTGKLHSAHLHESRTIVNQAIDLFIQAECFQAPVGVDQETLWTVQAVFPFPLFSPRISGRDSCKGGRSVTPQIY